MAHTVTEAKSSADQHPMVQYFNMLFRYCFGRLLAASAWLFDVAVCGGANPEYGRRNSYLAILRTVLARPRARAPRPQETFIHVLLVGRWRVVPEVLVM